MVVFVAMIGGRGVEGQFVICLAISHALRQQAGEVVATVKGKTSTLHSEYLQGEIAQ